MVDVIKKEDETFDQWCNRIVEAEKKENARVANWEVRRHKEREKAAKRAWNAWVKRSMVPCGKKLAARRRSAFIKYIYYRYGVYGACS